jgi:hypothetical protein
MSDEATAVERMPVPMGVIAETGDTHPPLSESDLKRIAPDAPVVLSRSRVTRGLALQAGIDDPMDLRQTGWSVLFASDADPAIKEALMPLLDLRRSQVGDDRFFKIFDGNDGVRPAQSASSWAVMKGVSLAAPVSPRKGVPYYVLIVGSPSRIPFEFQSQLDLQWAVGRLSFDNVADYAAYAQHVVEYEQSAAITRKKRAAVWIPRNALDLATPLLAGSVVPEFLGETSEGDLPIGKPQGFDVATFVGEGQATKATLLDILRGTVAGGAPSIVFTGSHGAEWSIQDPAVQRERQGALVTQEWSRGEALAPQHYLAGADLTADVDLRGTMLFLFACFGGGCPATDSYYFTDKGEKIPLTPEPLIAKLPETMLRRGALAVIAHIDRAFSYAFEDVMGTPQAQLLRTPLELLARGKRAGLAADPLNLQWSALAAQLGMVLGNSPADAPRGPLVANLYIARDDARNYIVLGDPAARLRTESMT